ncbi:Eisosome component PIL1-domain-containing protein [Chaetomium strumarium]|uniref:Eisosome component PIL1-domain-containing protein n=1 Tax=Chaetomium strumarium TaxID=1170767 RepID=A0AAJ0M6K3_9PEZI|nr:Eisosome component PIL1-domain-containing protein [Chaetomium strumarium]
MSRRSTEGSRFSISAQWNRAFSMRSSNRSSHSTASTTSTTTHHRKPFSFASLRGSLQPELSKRLHRLIKSANSLVGAHETAARARVSVATQLSEWGEQTGDEAVSDVSDKVGVLLSELGEQEESYAQRLEEGRGLLKVIRDTERSVQPSRDGKRKIADEIAKVKGAAAGRGEEQSSAGGGGGGSGGGGTRLVTLEQELVRAEAENLVAEAQLGNVTRQKLREAYTVEFLATIERAEKQLILARHGLRLLQLLDDSPVVPGDVRPRWAHASQARQVLNDAEDDLREWRLDAAALLGSGGGGGDDAKTVAVDDQGTATAEPPREQEREKGKGKKEKQKQKEAAGEDGDGVSLAEEDSGGGSMAART